MDVPTVSVDDVADPRAEGWVVLDVREPWEWASGHIEGALHIPLGDLPQRVDELDPQAQTLVVCHVGARSASATAWLRQRATTSPTSPAAWTPGRARSDPSSSPEQHDAPGRTGGIEVSVSTWLRT